VATDARGVAFVTTSDGGVWRLDGVGVDAERVLDLELGLHAVAAADRDLVVVVGDAGAIWRSDDEGASWSQLSISIDATLHAVQVSREGDTVLAVGDDGVVVRVLGESVETQRPTAAALRAVHLDAHGSGVVVGATGTMLLTHDVATTFVRIAPGVGAPLLGVEMIGDEHL